MWHFCTQSPSNSSFKVSSLCPLLIARPFCCCCQHNKSRRCHTSHVPQYCYCKCSIGPDLKCSDCGRSVTPVRMHVVAFFTQHLQGEAQKGKKDTRRLKPRYYGEVLTRDEIISRMEKDEAEKKKKKRRGQKSDECQPSPTNIGQNIL